MAWQDRFSRAIDIWTLPTRSHAVYMEPSQTWATVPAAAAVPPAWRDLKDMDVSEPASAIWQGPPETYSLVSNS